MLINPATRLTIGSQEITTIAIVGFHSGYNRRW